MGLSLGLVPAFVISALMDPCNRTDADFCFGSSDYFGWVWPLLANVFGVILIFYIEKKRRADEKIRLAGMNIALLMVPYTVFGVFDILIHLENAFVIELASLIITSVFVVHLLVTKQKIK